METRLPGAQQEEKEVPGPGHQSVQPDKPRGPLGTSVPPVSEMGSHWGSIQRHV